MSRTFRLCGKKYRINTEKALDFVGAVGFTLMMAAAFVFFFGCCYGGFLR